jgi:hypothetical protein
MPSRAKLEWHGDALIRRVRTAAAAAVNDTVDATRDDARESHPWKNDERERTLKSGRKVNTHLEREIASQRADPAEPNPTGAVGYTRRKGFYGLFHEAGTVHEHTFPTIRPAADREFRSLASRIRRRLAGDIVDVSVGETRFNDE